MKELEELRRQIDSIDEKIVELLAQRMRIVSQVGNVKRRLNQPLTDEKREEQVRLRWMSLAQKNGLPETMVDSLLNLIFLYSKIFEINPSFLKKVVVVGYGGMAKSLVSLFKLSSHEVIVTGRDPYKAEKLAKEFGYAYMDPAQASRWGEFVILALPPSGVLSDFVKGVFPHFSGKVVMDISSSKQAVYGYLEKASSEHGFSYVSVHPLFGPYLYPVGEKIAVIPSKTTKDVDEVIEFWRNCGLVPVKTTLEAHEKAMALVQVLPHFYMLGLSRSLEKLRKEFDVDFTQFETTNFREIYKVVKRVNELKSVILEIQEMNPFSREVRKAGMGELENLFHELDGEKK
ncbi:MAG: chorismate mutase/prephenate dehydrogenase [Candidatus Aramenus sulfurataquae]|jgi:chorismate mutase/prephenate dehydrogenase|uniref:Chorismate mutase n=2 Tax=Candidatus Aramenus sulfurataquae TaxID=1326980 RepID=W7KP15_9CREN|nr:MAG: chorismate mutase/prephenate dehydrogenase [Candidatus Aramenus sulfurataquae]MCL7344218.1 chorismate mutase [Candidatus Aramenus sulfurataquae]